jgi:hypothetical protein
MIKIELPFDAADDILLAILYHAYETCYYCQKEDIELVKKDPLRYDYKREDIAANQKNLEAMETVIKYFSYPKENVDAKLMAIRHRRYYKVHIAKGMSQ